MQHVWYCDFILNFKQFLLNFCVGRNVFHIRLDVENIMQISVQKKKYPLGISKKPRDAMIFTTATSHPTLLYFSILTLKENFSPVYIQENNTDRIWSVQAYCLR